MGFFYLIFVSIFLSACATSTSSHDATPESKPTRETVATYHPIATKIGYDILAHGGNAFDAFVASTTAQYVLAAGVTSFSGPLGALLYDARTMSVVYLDAGFNTPLDPKQKWDASHPEAGQAALVPGAVAGLEAISKKYGKLSFREVLQPAIQLAENGFPLDGAYAGLLQSEYGTRLKRSSYALKTYFRDGRPLAKGEVLKLPVVAEFLKQLARSGSDYVYNGQWAAETVKEVQSQGGHLSLRDFSEYHAVWLQPAVIDYRGTKVFSPMNFGGLNTLLALKVLAQTDLKKFGEHYSQNADALEVLTLIEDEVSQEVWVHDSEKIRDRAFVENQLSDASAAKIWRRIEQKNVAAPTRQPGTHSYHVVVIDKDGNAITGTNTIESFPWGDDIFVQGIPLTASGDLPFNRAPGERRESALSMQIGMKNEKLTFASGAFSASLLAAEFQFVVNIVDYSLSAQEVVSLPRFGTRAWDMTTRAPAAGVWLDPRVDKSIVETLTARGLKSKQDGYFDTGLGTVAIVHTDGTVDSAIAPMSSIGFRPAEMKKAIPR